MLVTTIPNLTKSPESFADINNRQKFLKSPQATFLLGLMSDDVRKKFVKCYMKLSLEDVQKGKNKDLVKVIDWFQQNSEIRQMVKIDPTSSYTFDYLYQKANPKKMVDNYFPGAEAAYRIYRRLQAIIAYNKKLYPRMLETRDELSILSLCSGPNYGVVEAIASLSPELQERITLYNVDIASWAIDRGNELIQSLGTNANIKYIQGDARKILELGIPTEYDALDFIGTLCTKPTEYKVGSLFKMSFLIKEKGIIMTSIPMPAMIYGDPLTDFIMRITGWGMFYANIDEIREIAAKAGLTFAKPFEGLAPSFHDGKENHLMPILRRV